MKRRATILAAMLALAAGAGLAQWPSPNYPFEGYNQSSQACAWAMQRVGMVGLVPEYGNWWKWRVDRQSVKLMTCKSNMANAITSGHFLNVTNRPENGDWSAWLNAHSNSLVKASWRDVDEFATAARIPVGWFAGGDNIINLAASENGWKYVTNATALLTETWDIGAWDGETRKTFSASGTNYPGMPTNSADASCSDQEHEWEAVATTNFVSRPYPEPDQPPGGPWGGLPTWWVPFTNVQGGSFEWTETDENPSVTNWWDCDQLPIGFVNYGAKLYPSTNGVWNTVGEAWNDAHLSLLNGSQNYEVDVTPIRSTIYRHEEWYTDPPYRPITEAVIQGSHGSIQLTDPNVFWHPNRPSLNWPYTADAPERSVWLDWDRVAGSVSYSVVAMNSNPGYLTNSLQATEIYLPIANEYYATCYPPGAEGWSNQEFTAVDLPGFESERQAGAGGSEWAKVRTPPAQWWWDETGKTVWHFSNEVTHVVISNLDQYAWVMLGAGVDGTLVDSNVFTIVSATNSARLDPQVLYSLKAVPFWRDVYGAWTNGAAIVVLASNNASLHVLVDYPGGTNDAPTWDTDYSVTYAPQSTWGSTNTNTTVATDSEQRYDYIGVVSAPSAVDSNYVVYSATTNYEVGDWYTATNVTIDNRITTNRVYVLGASLSLVPCGGWYDNAPSFTIDPDTGIITTNAPVIAMVIVQGHKSWVEETAYTGIPLATNTAVTYEIVHAVPPMDTDWTFTNTVVSNFVTGINLEGFRGDRWERGDESWGTGVRSNPFSPFSYTTWFWWDDYSEYPSGWFDGTIEGYMPDPEGSPNFYAYLLVKKASYATTQPTNVVNYLREEIVADPVHGVAYFPAEDRVKQWDWTWRVSRTPSGGSDVTNRVVPGPSVIKWQF